MCFLECIDAQDSEFSQDKEHINEVHDLYDPNYTSKTVGKITLSYSAEVL